MASVRKFRVKTKLATVALNNGGMTVRDALVQADKAIADLSGEAIVRIDALVAEIDRRFGNRAAARKAESLEDLYELSSGIIDVAFAIPQSGVDRAARALCDLIDLSLERQVCDWEAIDVHVEALKMLRTMGDDVPVAHREAVLDGLGRVMRKRVGA